MSITGSQCRAARALVRWSREQISRRSGIDPETIAEFESGRSEPDESLRLKLRQTLEEGGAVFIEDGPEGGLGVRLKFNLKEVRAINKWEGEGGPAGDDDVWPA